MDLELELIGLVPERSNKIASAIVRELTQDDITVMEKSPPPPMKDSPVRRLSERHKNVARLLSEGLPVWEVSVITGYTTATIHHLKTDPAFQNLMQFYANHREEAFVPYNEKLAEVGVMALDIIRDRLEEQPDKQSFVQLMNLVNSMADRTGHGPQSTSNVNVQVNIADRLQAARKRIEAAKQIDVTATVIDAA